jgi:hypothetical protein
VVALKRERSGTNNSGFLGIDPLAVSKRSLARTRLAGTDGDTRPHQIDTNLKSSPAVRAELSRADTLLFVWIHRLPRIRDSAIQVPAPPSE